MPIPDRQKQRREYLRKKGIAISKGTLSAYMLFLLTIALPICGGIVVLGIIFASVYPDSDWLKIVGIVTLIIIVGSGGWWFCYQVLQRSIQQSMLPYVPPVTANTLPAEEVLVRSSYEPVQEQSAILLRAAQSGDTPAEELLRPSLGRE